MNSNNDNFGMFVKPDEILPASSALTSEAKEQIATFRALGLTDSEMGIVRDFPGGSEEILINRKGFIKAAQAIKGSNHEAISMLNENGADLTLDEELDIVGPGERMADLKASLEEAFAKAGDDPSRHIVEVTKRLTLGQLFGFLSDTLKQNFPGGIETVLGSNRHRAFLCEELRRLCLRYGRGTLLSDRRVQAEPHTVAVIMCALGTGEPTREGFEEVKKATSIA